MNNTRRTRRGCTILRLFISLSLILVLIPNRADAETKSRKRGKAAPPKAAVVDKTKPLSDKELGRFQYCGDDYDCMFIANGCCDCANGGKDTAVARQHEQEFRDLFDCRSAVCTMRAAVPACGSGVVTCVNHTCKYVAPAAMEEFGGR
jgi:hypothetical protein